MEATRKIPPLGKAELEAVLEKIFKDYHIAVIDSTDVFEVMYDTQTRLWMRRRVSRALVTDKIVGYIIGRYIIIFKFHSKEVLFVEDLGSFSDYPFRLLPFDDNNRGNDFVLCSYTGDDLYIYAVYSWNEEDGSYETSYCGTRKPECIGEPYKSTVTHNWNRMWIKKESLKSADNTIFYDYIVKYWTD